MDCDKNQKRRAVTFHQKNSNALLASLDRDHWAQHQSLVKKLKFLETIRHKKIPDNVFL